VQEITLEPIKFAFDAISEAETQNAAYDIVSNDGHLVIVLQDAINRTKRSPNKEVVHVQGVVQGAAQRNTGVHLYQHFTALLETGDIKVCRMHSALSLSSLPFLAAKQYRGFA
jgi:hypothetical protein